MAVAATLHCALLVAGPLIGMVMIVALCANLMQVGVLVSMQAACPSWRTSTPTNGSRRFFRSRTWWNF